LIALVTTLVTEGLLVSIGEVTVPWEEVASVVNGERLLDVSGNKIIVSVLAARALGLRRLGRQLRDALDSFDIVILL
jgi:hypothetical protein